MENLGKVAWREGRRNRQRSRYHSYHTYNMVVNTHGNLYIYYSECNCQPWLGIIVALMMTDNKTGRQIIQDTDDKTGKPVWKVFNANNKVIIITQNEHTAKYYYERK